MEQDKKQKPELVEEQLKEVAGGYSPRLSKAHEVSNNLEADRKRQIGDEKLAGVDGGRIPPLPEKPTTTTF